MQAYFAEFYTIISLIPKGKVATYGQIAKLAGLPKHARHVGRALKLLENDTDIPWHRVINSQGKMSLARETEQGENVQVLLLQSEGVVVIGAKVSLKHYAWQP